MTTDTIKPALIYARVSTTKQKIKGDGLESQITRCREFAKMRGLEVVEVFRDDASGKLTERPGMKSMLGFARKIRAASPVILIDDISRLARGLEAHLALRSAIQKVGASLESPSVEFGEDPDSILVENLLASVSQHQRQKNGEQVKNRMRSRLLNGYWPFQAPIGYRYEARRGRGKVLVPDEPIASIICGGLEGYACGRFETQAEVQRFFASHPTFPKDGSGNVRAQLVTDILTRVIYAGYLEAPNWDVSRREAQHEGLISLSTFHAIQKRREGVAKVPKRKDISEDFPLRGFVECGDCGAPLRSSWSRGRHGGRYAYYLCQTKTCESYGKSIKRAEIEGEFETLLEGMTPTRRFFLLAFDVFAKLWEQRMQSVNQVRRSLQDELKALEKQAEQLLQRILNAESQSLVPVYEKRLSLLEERKLELTDRARQEQRRAPAFKEGARTAMQFIANPYDHWKNGAIDDRRNVLKLTFATKLTYQRGKGYRTPETTLPFKALGDLSAVGNGMVAGEGLEPSTSGL